MRLETLTISLNDGAGKMTLNLDEYFPCTIKKIRHFDKKCIQSDPWNNDRNAVLGEISFYLQMRIKENVPEDRDKIERLKKNLKTVTELIGEDE